MSTATTDPAPEEIGPPPGYFAGFPFDAAPLDLAPIQTERLLLRPISERDAGDVWEYQRLDEVLAYIPWPRRDIDEAAAHTRRRAAMRTLAAVGDAVFLACVPVGTGRVVGDVMLRVSSVETAELEIGWVLHPGFQGRGYATEAAGATLRLAFDGIGAHRVVAKLDPRNAASARLCTRLGLVHEGTLRKAHYSKGEWSDSAVYAMVADEWRARENAPGAHTP